MKNYLIILLASVTIMFSSCSNDATDEVLQDAEFTISPEIVNASIDNMFKSGDVFSNFQHVYKENFSLIFTNSLGDEFIFNNLNTQTSISLPSGDYEVNGETSVSDEVGESNMTYVFKSQNITINSSITELKLSAECDCSLILYHTDLYVEKLFITDNRSGVAPVCNLIFKDGVYYAYIKSISEYKRTFYHYKEVGNNAKADVTLEISKLEVSKQYKYIFTKDVNNIGIDYPDMEDGSF